MRQQIKKIGFWIACTIGVILFLYAALFTISVIPAIILSPFIIFETIKDGGWSEISPYYKLVIICGGFIFIGIVLKELWSFIKWVKEKIK